MNKSEPILTDAEMHALISGKPSTLGLSIARLKDFIRQEEKAVVAKLVAEQEPVAWVHPDDPTRSITHFQKLGAIKDGGAIEKTMRVFSIPAYAHPVPNSQGIPDNSRQLESEVKTMVSMLEDKEWAEHVGKTDLGQRLEAVISTLHNELHEAQTKRPNPELARDQPCGCRVCYCENQVQCLGCGARNCGSLEVGEIPNPVYIDHIPDVGNMVSQSQKPVAWRITAKRFCSDFTKDRDIAQYWLEKEPENIKPLYLAPNLSIEPSDELITEIKAMADIRLVDGRVELSNVKEIIHAIVHHPIYAN